MENGSSWGKNSNIIKLFGFLLTNVPSITEKKFGPITFGENVLWHFENLTSFRYFCLFFAQWVQGFSEGKIRNLMFSKHYSVTNSDIYCTSHSQSQYELIIIWLCKKQEASRPDSSAVQSQLYTDYHPSWLMKFMTVNPQLYHRCVSYTPRLSWYKQQQCHRFEGITTIL